MRASYEQPGSDRTGSAISLIVSSKAVLVYLGFFFGYLRIFSSEPIQYSHYYNILFRLTESYKVHT